MEVVPLWNDHANIPNPSFKGGPSCYRRLKVFSKEMGAVLGERFVCMDLDMLVVDDLRPLLDRTEDFIAWKNPHPMWPYNGSMFMMTAGSRSRVWETFDPVTSPMESHRVGCRGSDQGWMSYILGKNEATWGPEDGVYSFQDEIVHRNVYKGRVIVRKSVPMPKGARVVVFHGAYDPWVEDADLHRITPWVREHYR